MFLLRLIIISYHVSLRINFVMAQPTYWKFSSFLIWWIQEYNLNLLYEKSKNLILLLRLLFGFFQLFSIPSYIHFIFPFSVLPNIFTKQHCMFDRSNKKIIYAWFNWILIPETYIYYIIDVLHNNNILYKILSYNMCLISYCLLN